MNPHRLSAAALALLAVSTARAAYPLVVDDAGVHPPGESEWVGSADAARTPAADALSENFGLAVGLLPRLEGSLGFGYGWLRDRLAAGTPTRDGVLDFTLGLKAPIVSGEGFPFAFTLSTTVKLPTASARLGLGTGFTDANVLAIATWSWCALSLDVNAGYTWTAIEDRAERAGDGGFAGAALRWQASDRLMLFAETSATLPTDDSTEPTAIARAGWQWEISGGVLIGGAVGAGYGDEATVVLGTIGLTIIR